EAANLCNHASQMKVVALRETVEGERRLPVTPQAVARYVKLGATVAIERGAGVGLGFSDAVFEEAGAELGDRADLLATADVLLAVQPPAVNDIAALRQGVVTVGL